MDRVWFESKLTERESQGKIVSISMTPEPEGSSNEQGFGNIPQAATSVHLINNAPVSRDVILREAIRQVVAMIDNFDASTVPQVVEAFDSIDAFRNAPISVTTSKQSIEGLNAGINNAGQLLLDTDAGQMEFSAADISVRGRL